MRHDPLKKYLAISIVLFFIFSSIPITKCTNTDNEVKSEFPATGFFYVTEKNGVWWFVTPKGEKFYSVGIGGNIISDFYYDNISDWYKLYRKRLDEWGFNSQMGRPTDLPLNNSLPYVYRFRFKQLVGVHGWNHTSFPDVFDSDWQNAVRNLINDAAKIYSNDSNLIGYETDNEMKWGPDTDSTLTLLELYMSAPAETPGKQELICFLRQRYDNNTDKFNRVWNMNIKDFDNLFNLTKFGIEGWRVQSGLKSVKLKLFKDCPLLIKEPQLLKQAEKDVTDFSRLVAKTYFSFINTTLKAADPNHLNLGVRFHLLGVPLEVLEECGKYVDVISINYYRGNAFVYFQMTPFISIKYGCVSLHHNWMYNYHEITGKPLLVGEFNFHGNEGSWPVDYKIIVTQKQRADLFEWYAINCLKNSYMVGYFWFNYKDDPLDKNNGMVNLWNEPYKLLVDRMSKINKDVIKIHEHSSKSIIIREPLKTCQILDIIPMLNFFKKIDTKGAIENYINLDIKSTHNSLDYTENVIYVDDEPGEGPGNPPENYTRIQDAINNSNNGDTIFVYNGTYDEKIFINESISLIGEGSRGATINGVYEESDIKYQNRVITIEADNVTVTGFNITGGDVYFSGKIHLCSGIYLKKHNDTNISDNTFYKLSGYGLISLKSDYTKITNNIFYYIEGCGIVTDSSNNSLISNNVFEENDLYGIWMSSCKNNTIYDNFVSQSKFGIQICKVHDSNICGNTLQKNEQKGICLKESNSNIITSNNFIGNPTPAVFFYSSDNVWDGNYWGRYRILPKIIIGKTGTDGLITVVNVDHHPLKEPCGP